MPVSRPSGVYFNAHEILVLMFITGFFSFLIGAWISLTLLTIT